MPSLRRLCLLLFALAGCSAWARQGPSVEELRQDMHRLRPLQRKLGRPQPGEWLYAHPEPEQSFAEYMASDPALPRGARRVLYVEPLGGFAPAQREVLARTEEFLGLYFNLPVKPLPELPLALVPARARRAQPGTGYEQLLTSYILGELLKPRVPADGAALLAFTAWDLWPRPTWSYVFGEASLGDRVGVWSLFRYGDPALGEEAFRRCLRRAIATASHETGHMFSLPHCARYACNMNGSDSLEESDRQPLTLCPDCLAKLCWATGTRPQKQLKKLADFCARNGLKEDEAAYQKQLAALGH